MTKEEMMDSIINDYKNGNQSAMSDYCDRTRCSGCPFDSDICTDEVSNTLIDRLIKAEEHQKAETNLEHYVAYYNNYDQCIYMDAVKLTNESHRRLNNFDEAIEWLLEPYKPPKPKYKMSKFEYDLIQEFSEHIRDAGHCCRSCFKNLQEKGYFKGVPTNARIEDILDNCEVID